MFRKTNTNRRSLINTLSICLVAIFYAHLVKIFEARTLFRIHIDKETGALDVQDGWVSKKGNTTRIFCRLSIEYEIMICHLSQ